MEEMGNIKVLFIAGFGPIVPEPAASRRLYNQTLGIAFKEESGGYLHTEALRGAKTRPVAPFASSGVMLWKGCLACRNSCATCLA